MMFSCSGASSLSFNSVVVSFRARDVPGGLGLLEDAVFFGLFVCDVSMGCAAASVYERYVLMILSAMS